MIEAPKGFILVPLWAIKMFSFDGYCKRYFHHVQSGIAKTAAHSKTEEEFRKYFGISRYKSFQSFREMTYKHKKNQRLIKPK